MKERAVPSIVPDDLFEAVRRVIEQHRSRPTRPGGRDYLLRGLVVCLQCGSRMVLRSSRGTWRGDKLVCSLYYRHKPIACQPFNWIDLGELRDLVEAEMRLVAQDAPRMQLVVADDRLDRIKELDARLAELLRRRQRVLDAYEAGAFGLEDLRSRLGDLEEERRRLEAERARMQDEATVRAEALRALRRAVQDVLGVLESDAPIPEKNAALAQVVREIRVSRKDQKVQIVWQAHLTPLPEGR